MIMALLFVFPQLPFSNVSLTVLVLGDTQATLPLVALLPSVVSFQSPKVPTTGVQPNFFFFLARFDTICSFLPGSG